MAELQTAWPSWSWASIHGEILGRTRIVHERCYAVSRHDRVSDIRFELKNNTGDIGVETKIEAAYAIEMRGYVGKCAVMRDAQTRKYQMSIAQENGRVPRDALFPSGDENDFEIYPDEEPDAADLSCGYSFIMLAASSDHSRSAVEVTTPKTFSGIGLILLSLSEFAKRKLSRYGLFLNNLRNERDQQEEKLKTLRREKTDEAKIAGEKYWLERLDERVDGLNAWIESMKKAERDGDERGKTFRRVGAIHFRNVSRETWERISRVREDIWLQ